jgi:hypothetical protein
VRERDWRSARKGWRKALKCKKDVKLEGTNSTTPLESTKVSKNELKTNWFFGPNEPPSTPKNGAKCNL